MEVENLSNETFTWSFEDFQFSYDMEFANSDEIELANNTI